VSDNSELMAFLADNTRWGIGIATFIVVTAYITISISAIKRVYKYKGRVTAWGMIPVIHIFLFLTGVHFQLPKKKAKPKKEEKQKKENTETKQETEENDLDIDLSGII